MTSLTDDQYKLVYSNLGDRLRVAGTAELSGYSLHLNYRRCRAILENVRNLFPRAGNFDKSQFWAGLRPATPSNMPYLGRTRSFRNLWLNTGHGTLGRTMGAGSGKRVADMITAGDGTLAAWRGCDRGADVRQMLSKRTSRLGYQLLAASNSRLKAEATSVTPAIGGGLYFQSDRPRNEKDAI